jgi:ATP-dependent protease ClpP protease subunit
MKNLITLLFFSIVALSFDVKALTLSERNTVSFDAAFNMKSVTKLQSQILEKHFALPKTEDINVVIFSPGGSIIAGNNLIQFMNDIDRRFNVVCKFCASMAFHTFQGLSNSHRFLTSDGILMTHKARGSFGGTFPGQANSILNVWLEIIKRMDENVVAKTGGKHTLDSYRKLYADDYWCEGSNCINQGFADHVVAVSCDKTLSGTQSQIIRFFGKRIKVYTNKCPLIRGVVDYEILGSRYMEFEEVIETSLQFEESLVENEAQLKSSEYIKKINLWNQKTI